MSRVHMLRCLVNERLTAAAVEISALFETTIAEYEEELCRSKDENRRKQRLLDSVLSPRLLVPRADAQVHLMSAGLNQELTETPQIKQEPEEQSIKQEQLQEFTAVSVKSEEQSSLLPRRQSEHGEETPGHECDSETEEHTDDEDCSSTQLMETEADGDLYDQVTSVQYSHPGSHFESSPETSDPVSDEHVSGSDVGVKVKNHQCSVCKKTFSSKQALQRHTRIHTGEKPYSCSVCQKRFTQNIEVKSHMRTHKGEKPYSCLICQKAFTIPSHLTQHVRTHTGEKPYSCSICKKTSAHKSNLNKHMRMHTGAKPYS